MNKDYKQPFSLCEGKDASFSLKESSFIQNIRARIIDCIPYWDYEYLLKRSQLEVINKTLVIYVENSFQKGQLSKPLVASALFSCFPEYYVEIRVRSSEPEKQFSSRLKKSDQHLELTESDHQIQELSQYFSSKENYQEPGQDEKAPLVIKKNRSFYSKNRKRRNRKNLFKRTREQFPEEKRIKRLLRRTTAFYWKSFLKLFLYKIQELFGNRTRPPP